MDRKNSTGAAQLTSARTTPARILRLVPKGASEDTLEALSILTSEAKRGELIGIAFAAMYAGGKYWVSAAGEAYRNPAFALGMVDMLAERLRGQADSQDK